MNSSRGILRQLIDPLGGQNLSTPVVYAGRGAAICNIVTSASLIGFGLAYRFAPELFKEVSKSLYRGIMYGLPFAGIAAGLVGGAGVGLVVLSCQQPGAIQADIEEPSVAFPIEQDDSVGSLDDVVFSEIEEDDAAADQPLLRSGSPVPN